LGINHRDHRKLLVVNQAVAVTGGIHISRVDSSASFGRGSAGNGDLLKTMGCWCCRATAIANRVLQADRCYGAIVLGRDFGQQPESVFQRDMTNSRPSELDAWRRRDLGERFVEQAGRLAEWLVQPSRPGAAGASLARF